MSARLQIILPLTTEAILSLEQSTSSEISGEQFQILDVSDKLDILFQAGILTAIGAACGEIFDEYEETEIPPDRLPAVRDALRSRNFRITGPNIDQFCDRLIAMCEEGARRQAPLYFIL